MPGKEKIAIVRSKDFESVDEELCHALERLEEVNDRVQQLLETEAHVAPATEAADDGAPETGASESASEAQHTTTG